MTTTQRHLDRFLTALDLDRGAAAELRHLAEADTHGSKVCDPTDLVEDFDVRWTQVESRRARDDAVRTRGRRVALTAVSAFVVTGAVTVGVFLHDTDRNAAPVRSPLAADLDSSGQDRAAQAAGDCPATPVVTGHTVRGSGGGGTDSGPGAVMAFETAYYVTRSGIAARAVTTPDANVPAAETIQAGIDTIPADTRFCVVVDPSGPNSWQVELTETRPGRAPIVYRQTVTTTVVDGRVLITGITPR
ncbi:hypothetical protein [Nocardia transvalensis]|uniref:hypothetical protein n=1 Tax=Nocardia transvalensis TaxID=37333 RepID=UPI001894C7E8|nr:hypothetical protein [Nocardia transvalensis]MBF6333192.1 hypothetical protein [Nocardia transvalensis]